MATWRIAGTVTLIALVTKTVALVAYDCSTLDVNATVISRRDVAPCTDDPDNYKVHSINVQVLQRDDVKLIQVKTCLVEVTRLIVHCGIYSHSSVVEGGLSNYIHPIGADDCDYVHRHRILKFHHHNIKNVVINGSKTADITLFGSLWSNGTCKGTSYRENARKWDNVVVQASVKITTAAYYTAVKLDTNEIKLRGGITCQYLKGYCLDSTYGETIWHISTTSSCQQVATLYQGRAVIITERPTRKKYLVVEEGDNIFSLAIVKHTVYCEIDVLQTEHPRIMVVNLNHSSTLLRTSRLLTENVNLISYTNSKFLYLEQSFKRNPIKMSVDLIRRRCELHREILKTKLTTVPLSPDTIATLIGEQQGYVGRILGEVIYIMKCTPTRVLIRKTPKCYNELPITVGNNQSKFMSPITHIIQDVAEELDCNNLIPPLYFIEGNWMGFTPEPITRNPPLELSANQGAKQKFDAIQQLGAGGFYTQEEVENAQQNLRFGNERKAVENLIVRRISKAEIDDQGFSMVKLLNEDEMKELARNTFKRLWGWFTDIGIVTSGLMGIYFIYWLVKYVLGVAINCWQIYRTMGCGPNLLAGFWNTCTVMVLHRYYARQARQDKCTGLGQEVIAITETEAPVSTEKRGEPVPPKLYSQWT